MNDAGRTLRDALQDRAPLWPRLGDLTLAEGGQEGLVAMLEVRGDPREQVELASLRHAVPALTGFGVHGRPSGGGPVLVLSGQASVSSDVLGLRLSSHALSFFQANRFLVEPLARSVVAWVPTEGEVLDLYAGVGLFSLPLAARGQDVRGVEIDETAVGEARQNAHRAGLDRVRIEAADVRAALSAWPRPRLEQVVLDPPRTGAGREVVSAIAERCPASIVYVSCDPPTLARDLALFARAAYALEAVSAFDMFPDTFHLETIALLRPA
jgi:tRNA/tmRNA/rRNA uracil-C5-methylase (TrmA/RlmC/RlmD family)